MGDNYYIILDLDPGVDDWPTIRKRIEDCRRRWAMQKNQGPPDNRRKADQNLRLIPEMLKTLQDPEERKGIACAARELLEKRKTKAVARLDELVAIAAEGGGAVDPETLKKLVQQMKGRLSEAEVLDRLKELGVTVAARDPARSRPTARPTLDATRAREIRDNLQYVKSTNLYEFLEMSRCSSPGSLHDRADQIYKETNRKGKTDSDTTVRLKLAGHAMAVFRNAEMKERYDNTCAFEPMEALTEDLDVAGANGSLSRDQFDRILRKAREKGVNSDIAIQFISEYAQRKKWGGYRAYDSASMELKQCGFCRETARKPEDTRCHNCGEELIQPCPRCGHPTPTQDKSCGKCGCRTGDAPLVNGLLREGREHLAHGDLSEAQSCFDRALVCWENWQPAIEGRRLVEAARRDRESAFRAIDSLMSARKLEEAERELGRVRRRFGRSGGEEIGRRIKDGLDHARAAFRDAEALRQAARMDDAVDKLTEALRYCTDFQPALRALADSPPPAPSSLRVALAGGAAQLTWTAAKTRGSVTYRVQRKAVAAPIGPDDGTTVGDFPASICHDSQVPPGTPWFYSVFSVRGGVASVDAATSGPHMLLADPTEVVVDAGDGRVSLRWKRPHGCTVVEVWRENGSIPTAPGKGTCVTVSGDSVVDQDLKNGTSYGYLIVACYTDPSVDRGVLKAPGVGVVAVPVLPPPAVRDLRVRCENRVATLEWTPPARGDVQIRMTSRAPAHTPGMILPLSTADQFGTPVPVLGSGTTKVTILDQGRVFFTPLSVISQTAVAGAPVSATSLDEITELRSQRDGDTIRLTWSWPANAGEVIVAWRYDAYPEDPDDANGGCRLVKRSEYDRAGLWALRNAERGRHYFTLFVRDADVYSTGVRVIETGGMEIRIRYSVRTRRRSLIGRARDTWVHLSTDDDVGRLPAVLVVLKKGSVPLNSRDGRTIAEVDHLGFRNGEAGIPLQVDGAAGFVRLFFRDSRHAGEFRLLPAADKQLKIG